MDHHKRDKKCFVCSAPTNGIFNIAKSMSILCLHIVLNFMDIRLPPIHSSIAICADIVEKLKKKDSLDEAEEQNFA